MMVYNGRKWESLQTWLEKNDGWYHTTTKGVVRGETVNRRKNLAKSSTVLVANVNYTKTFSYLGKPPTNILD